MSVGRSRVALELKGVALLVVIGALVWLSIASYNKTFVDSVDVSVRVERAGLQLPKSGDVRMRGTIIGRITAIEPRADGVEIDLALDPAAAELVSKDAVARILPTTLFGQKYVELVEPGDEATASVEAGDVLLEDTSQAAVELTAVLDRLEPLLSAVRPQDLSMTLQAMADGLEGRGDQLGRTAVKADAYLRQLNTKLPELAVNLRLLGVVTNAYADAAPDILALLDNATLTGNTVLDNKDELQRFYAELTTFANRTRAFLDRNGDGIVELNRVSRPVLELLGRYAPQLPCLLEGLLVAETTAGKAFRDGVFHATVRMGEQFPGYTAADMPRFGDLGAGPHCAGLPTPSTPVPENNSDDGASNPSGSSSPPLEMP